MKKLLALLMTLVMIVSCVVCFSVSSSAVEYVEETYSIQSVLDAFGTHEVNDDYSLKAEPMFGNGLWTYEWYDLQETKFKPMGVYVAKAIPTEENGALGGWAGLYTTYVESCYDKDDYTNYCMIYSNGKNMHPGTGAGPVMTYIAPANGKISFDAGIFAYAAAENNKDGTSVYVYKNDERIWPASEEEARMLGGEYTAESPKEVSVTTSVSTGDRIRMVVTCSPETGKGSKGTTVANLPVVTWLEADVPIGNPNGTAPTGILTTKATSEGCKVTWNAAKNAAGYNIYVDGKKVNDSLVTGTEYIITGLEANKMYDLTITTVTTSNKESEPSVAQPFRTKKATTESGPVVTPPSSNVETPVDSNSGDVVGSVTDSDVVDATGTSTDDTTPDNTASTSKKTTAKKTSSKKTTAAAGDSDGSSFPWWILIVVGGVAVVAVVLFFVLKKKKPAEEVAEGEIVEGEIEEGEAEEEVSEDAPEAPTEE